MMSLIIHDLLSTFFQKQPEMALSPDNNTIKSKGYIHLFFFFLMYRYRDKIWKAVSQVLHQLFLSTDVLLLMLICILSFSTTNRYSFGNKKTNNNDITYTWNLSKAKIETESKTMIAKGWGVGEIGRSWSKHTDFQL